MSSAKDAVAASIIEARAQLNKALEGLQHLPSFDPHDIGFAAHALNNYLTVTAGTVEVLLFALQDHPDPDVRVWLEALQHATNLMARTAGQLMGGAAKDGPKLLREKVDLVTPVQRCCNYYEPIAGRKQIALTCECAAEWPYVWVDRVALAAVMDNLLSNAVKYSPAGKSISVQITAEAGHLVCSVRDQGPGLSTEDQARLFQRGVRLGAVPTGGEPSSGYGLAVAKELIDALGGQIGCESEPGKGACFSIRLPIHHDSLPNGGQALQGPHLGSPGPGPTKASS
jgi:signal transduction histidine kinase